MQPGTRASQLAARTPPAMPRRRSLNRSRLLFEKRFTRAMRLYSRKGPHQPQPPRPTRRRMRYFRTDFIEIGEAGDARRWLTGSLSARTASFHLVSFCSSGSSDSSGSWALNFAAYHVDGEEYIAYCHIPSNQTDHCNPLLASGFFSLLKVH